MNHIAKLGCAVMVLGAISTNANSYADTLLGVYAGGQMWAMETEGAFASNNELATFNYDDERNGSYYLALEHFVPLVPNAKVIHTTMDTNGATNLTGNLSFAGQDYAVNTRLGTDLSLTTTDYILYYEILDNDIISIDVGINAKNIDGEIAVLDEQTNTTSQASFSGYVPMIYSRAEVGLPFTSWSVFAEGSYLSFDDHTISDMQAALEYRAIDSLALNLNFQLGYRIMNVELDDLDSINTELDFSGVFAGIEFHF